MEVGCFALLLWGSLIGLALFGEIPTPRFWIGALIMIGGIVLVIIEPTSQATEASRR